jgi:ribonuclease P protein component
LSARLRLARAQRLGTAEVARVLKVGRVTRGGRLSVYSLPNSLAYARLALIVPKRLAPQAVLRNRVRRLAREAFRLRQPLLDSNDCVIRLIRSAADPPVTREEVDALLLHSVAANG